MFQTSRETRVPKAATFRTEETLTGSRRLGKEELLRRKDLDQGVAGEQWILHTGQLSELTNYWTYLPDNSGRPSVKNGSVEAGMVD